MSLITTQNSTRILQRLSIADRKKAEFEIMVSDKHLQLFESAKKRNKDFNLSQQSVRNLMKSKTCYFTGVPLTDANRSIDRIFSEIGYMKGNVCACDRDFNCKKGGMSFKETEQVYKKLLKLREKAGV